MKFSLIVFFGVLYASSVADSVVVEADKSPDLTNEREEENRESEPTTSSSKAIPLGDTCDRDRDACQCYGKDTFCGCGFLGLGSCTCTVGSKIVISMKKFCPNKEEWAKDYIVPTTPRPKAVPLGASCNRNGDACQCYGKDTFCDCGILKLGSCSCVVGNSKTITVKSNCPNKEEWENEDVTEQKFKSKPVGTECDLERDICQCYGKRSYCDCEAESCTCKEANEGDYLLTTVESLKSNCANKKEWESD